MEGILKDAQIVELSYKNTDRYRYTDIQIFSLYIYKKSVIRREDEQNFNYR